VCKSFLGIGAELDLVRTKRSLRPAYYHDFASSFVSIPDIFLFFKELFASNAMQWAIFYYYAVTMARDGQGHIILRIALLASTASDHNHGIFREQTQNNELRRLRDPLPLRSSYTHTAYAALSDWVPYSPSTRHRPHSFRPCQNPEQGQRSKKNLKQPALMNDPRHAQPPRAMILPQ
jgi:hypothetical protein